jgi:hypothetical protein
MKTLDMAGDHVFCASALVNESHGLASLGHSGSCRVLCSSTPFDTVKTHHVIFHDSDGSDLILGQSSRAVQIMRSFVVEHRKSCLYLISMIVQGLVIVRSLTSVVTSRLSISCRTPLDFSLPQQHLIIQVWPMELGSRENQNEHYCVVVLLLGSL